MEVRECLKSRRSIRKFTAQTVAPELIADLIETTSYSPSWKHTQICRYVAVTGELKDRIAEECTSFYPHNCEIIKSAPLLMVQCFIKNRSGFERDGSYSTHREGGWQMYDAGIQAGALCNAAHDLGLGSVILGIFDDVKVAELIHLSEDREVVALIPMGYADETPNAPRRKSVEDLLTFLS